MSTSHTAKGASAPTASPSSDEVGVRLAALSRILDWAQSEAASLRAQDAGVCLQLARLALDLRRRDG
jgi:hypothetical protein